jgi:hypothetical protein
MPEAIAILAVTAFVVIFLVVAGVRSAGRSPREKLAQLQQRLDWLEQREQQAGAHGWDGQMRASVAGQLEETRRAIAALQDASSPPPGKELE